MKKTAFFDLEVNPQTQDIHAFGALLSDGNTIHTRSKAQFLSFISDCLWVCGHNILAHDLQYIGSDIRRNQPTFIAIDTLILSPLLFPDRAHHALLKDDKLQVDTLSNPLNDSKKAKALFDEELAAYRELPEELQCIYCALLSGTSEFSGFFSYVEAKPDKMDLEGAIRRSFQGKLCEHAQLDTLISEHPVELAYALASISSDDRHAGAPGWVIRTYPYVEQVFRLLRNTFCAEGCAYCNQKLDVTIRLREIFGFNSFRTYDGEPLQEKAARAAVEGKSILAIFPTGGGKSLTFQLPALIAGETVRGLTVVISPLQSLMKDQVDNLESLGIVDAVTINGLLSPVERAEAMDRVESGMASLLYISPESLRSNSIERLLLSRNIVRFVIDEAHCFSAWGQDFRVDYLYIGDFIRKLQKKKNLDHGIAVSCFTATAKQKVVSDIRDYFKEKLNIELDLYTTGATRTNLRYLVLFEESDEAKYSELRRIIRDKECPTIVYVSRTKRTHQLAEKLTEDGLSALPFNGRMDKNEKIANQEAFIKNEVQVIVATSAFGMGVDKKDVRLVIHYDISDSLENYLQEAGRAGRDENLDAECFVLFNDDDLDKHFILLNQTKLSISEIQQVWKAIKDLTHNHPSLCRSPLEIARQAGWDESVFDIETRVKTAVAALEEAGYIVRGNNSPKVYATSILVHNMQEAAERIQVSHILPERLKLNASRIIKSLISSRSIASSQNDDAESRVDYLADRLGIPKDEVVETVNLLREEGILADNQDMTAFIHKTDTVNKSSIALRRFARLEDFLIQHALGKMNLHNYKELSDKAIRSDIKAATVRDIKTILYYWTIRGYIKKDINMADHHSGMIPCIDSEMLKQDYGRRIQLAGFIINTLFEKCDGQGKRKDSDESPVQFSIMALQKGYNAQLDPSDKKSPATSAEVQNVLLYLSKIGALNLDGGFLVLYNALQLKRLILDNKIRYKNEDYRQLSEYYRQKIQQIHIVGEYAHMMVKDYAAALQFVGDYFHMDYKQFLTKYFEGEREKEINRNITATQYDKLFGGLSGLQKEIIGDDQSKYIVVAAGPGSGKTRVLVHKLASLMQLEDAKHEQLLMLTFSRAAATEFKTRLLELIGGAARFVEIRTFHSYCFNLLGKIGNLEDSANVVETASQLIVSGEAEMGSITKTVLVIDEAQDMDASEFALVQALMARNEDMRVIAVGDDDQNIYEFRGSSSGYMQRFITEYGAICYEMTENYRSTREIVRFADSFVETIARRMKSGRQKAISLDDGKVVFTRHTGANLEVPLMNQLCATHHSGMSACILTSTNEEALRMMGLLIRNRMDARLIQSNDGFNLYNLVEIRYFLKKLDKELTAPTISRERWEGAKAALRAKYAESACLTVCMSLIETFEKLNTTKYRTDLEEFIRESHYEDFIENPRDVILVSTMHKAKGREFDQVYMLLNHYSFQTDANKRAAYVGFTRAQKALYIHCNSDLPCTLPPNAIFLQDGKCYPEPEEIMLQLSYQDVVLNFFKDKKSLIFSLRSGQTLFAKGAFLCASVNGQTRSVVMLSKKARAQLEGLAQKEYRIQRAEIRFIAAWKGKEDMEETAVIFPDVYLKKTASIS